MKKTNLIIICLLAFAFVYQGCQKNDTPPDQGKTMDDMIAPDGFTFETTHDVAMTINMPNSVDFSNLRSRFDVYTENPNNDGKLITSGSFDENGRFTGTLRLPIILKEITVVTFAGTVVIPVPESSFKEDGVIINFGDDYGYLPPDTVEPSKKAEQEIYYNVTGTRDITSTNLIGNGDFETNDLVQYIIGQLHILLIRDGILQHIEIRWNNIMMVEISLLEHRLHNQAITM